MDNLVLTNCRLYLVNNVVTMVMCVFGVTVTILTFISNFMMAMYFRQLKRRPGGMLFYKAIIFLSIFASIVGKSCSFRTLCVLNILPL